LVEGLYLLNLYLLDFYNLLYMDYQTVSDHYLLSFLIYNYGVKRYDDPLNSRDLIREENNGKVGIYCWVNNVNEKNYIGSGEPLYLRLSDYYQSWYPLPRLIYT